MGSASERELPSARGGAGTPVLERGIFTSFLKGSLKKSISDPYDIDGFLLSYSRGVILP